MDKRKFLKTSTALLAGSVLAPITSCRSDMLEASRTNWAGNLTYSNNRLHLPNSVGKAQSIVRRSTGIRALGSRHSFNALADSRTEQISLVNLHPIMELDAERSRVTVAAGVLYGELNPFLHDRGFALHNLASLPHISIAGACATATHGSGVSNGNLATAVVAFEMINADGDIVSLSREEDGDLFPGAVAGLGALGVVTQLTLAVEPAYDVAQHVYLGLPLDTMQAEFDAIMESGYSVSLFTDWQSDVSTQVWRKQRVDTDRLPVEPVLHGATLADRHVHPILALPAEHCTEQMGIPGPWHERLPHFRPEHTPSSGNDLQTEYFIPSHRAPEAIEALRAMGDRFASILMISEIRTIAEDDLWLSPCYGRPSVAIHFTWNPDWLEVQLILPELEELLDTFEARPHWGKLFATIPTDLHARYSRMTDFKSLAQAYDPNGKFRNDYLELFV